MSENTSRQTELLKLPALDQLIERHQKATDGHQKTGIPNALWWHPTEPTEFALVFYALLDLRAENHALQRRVTELETREAMRAIAEL